MKHTVLFLITTFAFITSANANQFDVFGTFLTEEKNSQIEIAACGDSVCGKVVWLNPETLEDGVTPETATSKKGEKVLGLTMLQGFEKARKDWRDGTIYDPGKDKTYASRLKRLDDGNLEVKGCIAFICQTQIWEPVSIETDTPQADN
ncbi:MAG: DUF2147 domain-containing protein [Pseudomonadota bacterium]